MPKRPVGLRSDNTVAVDSLPALKSNHGIPSLVAEDAVDPAALQVAERDEPPLQRDDRTSTVAVAQLGRGRHTRQRKQDGKCSKKRAAASSLEAASRVVAEIGTKPPLAFPCSAKR